MVIAIGSVDCPDLVPLLEVGFTFVAFLAAVLCAAVAGIFPARRAADMNPVDALRAS